MCLYYSFTTSTADLYLLRLLKLTQLNYNISCKHKYKHPTVQPRICCSLQLRFKRESVEFFRARKKCSGLSVYSLPGWGVQYLVKVGWVGQQNGYPKPYCSKKFIHKLDVRTRTSIKQVLWWRISTSFWRASGLRIWQNFDSESNLHCSIMNFHYIYIQKTTMTTNIWADSFTTG